MPDRPPSIDYATPSPPRRRPIAWIVLLTLLVLLSAAFLLWVTGRSVQIVMAPPAPITARPAVLPPTVPSRVTIVQRQEQPLPGSNGTLIAHLGDITGGQAILTIRDSSGALLLNSTSVSAGDVQTFDVGNSTFEIEAIELRNFLTGDDFGVFAIRQKGASLTEQEKIERLIDAVAAAPGLVFIRNDEEHNPTAAADHLRRKYSAVEEKNITARQFIDELASKSSTSGEAYRVKLPDGREMSSKQWLSDELRRIEGNAGPATTQSAK